jgi:hypothetical protein
VVVHGIADYPADDTPGICITQLLRQWQDEDEPPMPACAPTPANPPTGT